MSACSVLRCLKVASSSFALLPYSDREIPVCIDHKGSLDSGATWMMHPNTDLQTLSEKTGSADITILMGQDFPSWPRLVSFGLSPTIGKEVGYSVELTIETPEGQQKVTFWMTGEEGRKFGSWLTKPAP